MEEDKNSLFSDLFGQANPDNKKKEKPNPLATALSSIDKFKRQRDEDAEDLRRKQRDRMFKLRRHFEDELPEFNIPEANIEIPKAVKEPMQEDIKSKELSLVDLPLVLAEFNSTDPEVCLSGLTKMRLLLAKDTDSPIQELIDAGVVPRLIELLKYKGKSAIQLEAAWCISNIAAGEEKHVKAIVESGGIYALMSVLESPHRKNQEPVLSDVIVGDMGIGEYSGRR
jgi:hypothetical protein